MKRCSKCKAWKEEEEFAWRFKGLNVRHPECNECRKKYQAEYYHKTKKDRLEYKTNRLLKAREKARAFVFNYLSHHVCVDCGEYDPLVLTFDHVRGKKKMNVSEMVHHGYSIEALQEELNKCEVVCSNCHTRREKKRRGTKYWIL